MTGNSLSLKRDFFKYVIPSVIAQWVYALYTIVDGLFVARGVSETALTAVNLSFPFVSTLFSLSLMFAVGTSTIVAIFLGHGQHDEGCRLFTQNIVIQLLVSVPIIAFLMPQLEHFAYFLGAPDRQAAALVAEYLRWIVPFTPFFLLSYSFEIMLKIDGFPQKATAIVTVGVVGNCLLDWLIVIVLKKGIAGAAFATSLSQGLVTLFYLRHFLSKKGELSFQRFRFSFSMMLRQIRNGLGAGVTEFSSGIVTFIFNQVIRMYLAPDTLVSYTIVSYVNSLVMLSVTGVAHGSQPLISFYCGRGERPVCRTLFRYCLITVCTFSAFSTVFCYESAGVISQIFIGPELSALREYSVFVFHIFVLSFLPMSLNVVISGYFTAIEHPYFSLVISIGRGFLFLACSLLAIAALFGGDAIWWAPLVSESVCLVIALSMLWSVSAKRMDA